MLFYLWRTMMSFLCSAGVWWVGLDPGGINPRKPGKPSGLGDVRLRLLLRYDLSLDDPLHRRLPQEQLWMGCCCKTETITVIRKQNVEPCTCY